MAKISAGPKDVGNNGVINMDPVTIAQVEGRTVKDELGQQDGITFDSVSITHSLRRFTFVHYFLNNPFSDVRCCWT